MSETKVITVRLPLQDARRVEFVARANGVSVNEVFRSALDHYLTYLRGDEQFMAQAQATLEQDAAIARELA